jgi:hypothetical protein
MSATVGPAGRNAAFGFLSASPLQWKLIVKKR